MGIKRNSQGTPGQRPGCWAAVPLPPAPRRRRPPRACFALKGNRNPARGGHHGCDLGFGMDGVLLFQLEEERLHQVAIRRRDDLGLRLNHGDGRTQGMVDLGHLQANDAATDRSAARCGTELRARAAVVSQQIRGSSGMPGRTKGWEPVAMMACPKAFRVAPFLACNLQGLGIAKRPWPVTVILARLAQAVQAVGQLRHYGGLMLSQGRDIDVRRSGFRYQSPPPRAPPRSPPPHAAGSW